MQIENNAGIHCKKRAKHASLTLAFWAGVQKQRVTCEQTKSIMNTMRNRITCPVLHIHILSLKCILPYSKPFLKPCWAVNTCSYCQCAKLLTHSTSQFSSWQSSLRKILILNARCILSFPQGKLFCDANWDDLVYVKPSWMQREKVSWFHSGVLQNARVVNPRPG